MNPAVPRVLIVHNRYLLPGGEDVAVDAEARLLEQAGHEVQRYETSNESMVEQGPARAALTTLWNGAARSSIQTVLDRFKPDVVHVHNTFPFLSPSVYWIRRPPAIVQTLHNYRLVCSAGTLMRGGQPCEACVGGFGVAGVAHACYRGSRPATMAAALMVQSHRMLGTWARKVDAYIALTAFTKDIFVRGGLPAAKIHVKPNFVAPDPGVGKDRGEHFVFVGRLEEGKGIRVLMAAWRTLSERPPLRIIGSGPLQDEIEAFARENPNVVMLGQLPRERVLAELQGARALIAPMIWYENFPLSICEAMACGCPIIATDLPNVRAILADGDAGVLFEAGNAAALADAITMAVDAGERLTRVASHARARFEIEYTAEANYRSLMAIYAHAMKTKEVA